jgi:hypothetical protein
MADNAAMEAMRGNAAQRAMQDLRIEKGDADVPVLTVPGMPPSMASHLRQQSRESPPGAVTADEKSRYAPLKVAGVMRPVFSITIYPAVSCLIVTAINRRNIKVYGNQEI